MKKINLTTADGVSIVGNYFKADGEMKGWTVLLHMMPRTKESWDNFAGILLENGYESLAIDLRGHGESTQGPEGYINFSDEEHQKSIADVEAAVAYLKNQGAVAEKIVFIGASIGANLALQYIGEHTECKTASLLSPGLDYRGVKTLPVVEKLKSGQKIFIVTSKDDGMNSVECQALYEKIPSGVQKEMKVYVEAGHGTDILSNQPELKNLIINFIK